MDIFSLNGDVALVTGASAGLGRHFARVLATAGAKVAVTARRMDLLDEVVAEITDVGGSAIAVRLDVTDAACIPEALDAVETHLGPLAVVVNNAGLAVDKKLFDTDDADWDAVMNVNLRGPFLVAREAARRMVANKVAGRIVNIASILGQTASPRVHGYAASKAGLIHLTRTLASELARDNIRVNALAPGYVQTDLNRELLSGPVGDRLKSRTPLRRFARPEELDGPLLLLCSEAGSYMTGSVLTVDGGLTLSTL